MTLSSVQPRQRNARAYLALALLALATTVVTPGALALAESTEAGPTPSPTVDNLIFISIDSLRADHLGIYGYGRPTSPTLDSLAADGLVFNRAYSTSSWTLPSHTAMFTGLDDRAHGVRHHDAKVSAEIPTLAEELSKQGINTVGFYSGPYLHPTFGLGRGFSQYWNSSSVLPKDQTEEVGLTHYSSFKDVTNPIVLANIGKWLEGEDTIAGRNFIFIHMWDVHYSYIPPAKYLRMFDPDYEGEMDGTVYNNKAVHAGMAKRDLDHLIARYDAEIRYTDDTIRDVLALLDSNGLLTNAAVMVVSDHGEEFLDHGSTGHHRTLFEEQIHVPLILKIFGHKPKQPRIGKIVSLIDVYPTACELLGVPCHQNGAASESLVAFFNEGDAHRSRNDALADLNIPGLGFEHDAIVTPDGKAIRWVDSVDHMTNFVEHRLPEQSVPDPSAIASDPILYFSADALAEETHGEFATSHSQDAALLRTVARLRQRAKEADGRREIFATKDAGETPKIDEQTENRLRALGYMH